MSLVFFVVRGFALRLVEVLAPPTCAACDARLARAAVFCPSCAGAVLRAGVGEPGVAYAIYGGPVATALRRLKYGGRSDLAAPLGHLARAAVRSARLSAELVVPVPLHPARLAERGYNQAALLGVHVARELDVPLLARGLSRTRHTPQQARLDREARLSNVTGAFQVRAGARVSGKRVVLVDDVATTGATLSACAAELLDAGAASVTAVVVARAERDG